MQYEGEFVNRRLPIPSLRDRRKAGQVDKGLRLTIRL